MRKLHLYHCVWWQNQISFLFTKEFLRNKMHLDQLPRFRYILTIDPLLCCVAVRVTQCASSSQAVSARSLHVVWSSRDTKMNPDRGSGSSNSGFSSLSVWTAPLPGLSTRTLKTDSLDPDPRSGFHVVACELHTARRLRALTARLDLTHCDAARHAARIRIEAVWRQSGL